MLPSIFALGKQLPEPKGTLEGEIKLFIGEVIG